MPEPAPFCQTADPALPEPSDAALLTIDLQQAFADPGSPLFAPGTPEAAGRAALAAELFRQAGRPVIHVIRLYDAGRFRPEPLRRDLLQRFPDILAPGGTGALPVEGLLPPGAVPDWQLLAQGRTQRLAPGEHLLAKPRWGAFHATELTNLLASLGVGSLLLCGTYFPNCVRATAYEALSRDLRTAVIPEATAGCSQLRLSDLSAVGLRALTLAELPGFFGME